MPKDIRVGILGEMFRKRKKHKLKWKAWPILQFWGVGVCLRIILAAGIFYFMVKGIFKLSYAILSNSAYFELSQVSVKNHFRLEAEEAAKFAGLREGINLFRLNLSSISDEIKRRYPEYEEVIIKRILPNRIEVLIKERIPVIQIKLSKFYPLDRHGFLLPYAKDEPYPNLPIIVGIEPKEVELNKFSHSPQIRKALELMRIIEQEKFSWQKILDRINLTSLNDISLFLDNGLEVKIGGSYHLERLRRLGQVLDEIRLKSLEPGFIDLRFKDVIISP